MQLEIRGKRLLTLIGEGQARIGHVFKIFSIPEECRRCPLYQACMAKLKVGRRYRVVEVRRVNLPRVERCLLTGEALTPVIVEELPIKIAIPYTPNIIEGIVTTYNIIDERCQKRLSEDYNAIRPGTKIRIVKILDIATCNNRKFLIVLAEALD
ncbi:MAG: hypothetical protein GXO23_00095 [Crenarchaeota archaeon]|nr:hypothetical protein [Thermoproteota archaeon]